MDRLADFRNVFAQIVMARGGSAEPRLLRAFADVPRHEFIGPSPWYFTEHGLPAVSDDAALLYQDVVMGLAPARGLTTGLPSLHARCIAACELEPGAVFDVSFLCRARFIPCKGAGDESAYASLRSAFANGGYEAVRSLRLDPELPDETAWFAGRGWWLSTRPSEA